MISQINITVNAAKPMLPLPPLVTFNGSPSSVRVCGVPRSLGNWSIGKVRVLVSYPNNFNVEVEAVNVDGVWVATVDGCQNNGTIRSGFRILADGTDEQGNPVEGYVLGVGDVLVMPLDKGVERIVDKYAVRYLDSIPAKPCVGDLLNLFGSFKMWDGTKWVSLTGEDVEVNDAEITLSVDGVDIGSFTVNASVAKTIDIPVPSKVSEVENDVGYITASEVPTVPSNISAFNNDVGYVTAEAIPSKVSELDNDAGYITMSAIPAIPSKVSELDNDAGYITASAIPPIPSKTSDLLNDSGFITASAIPSDVSEFNNDAGYVTASTVAASYYNKTEINASMSDKRGIYDLDIYPTEVHTCPHWKVTVSYQGTTVIEDAILNITSQDEYETDWAWRGTAGYLHISEDGGLSYELEHGEDVVGGFALSATETVTVTDNGYTFVINSWGGVLAGKEYVDQSVAPKRDKTDMTAVVGQTYDSWFLSEIHTDTFSPALELKWGNYIIWGEQHDAWLVNDEYNQACYFLLPELDMLYDAQANADGTYTPMYGETITLAGDGLSIATISGGTDINCTRQSATPTAETSTIATLKDIKDSETVKGKRGWYDNVCPATVDATGKYTINSFSADVDGDTYYLDQFTTPSDVATWKPTGGDYPNITTSDGLNFTLAVDASNSSNFSMEQLKPGPAKGLVDGSQYAVSADFKLTTYAEKDYVDAQIGAVLNEQF